MSDRTEKAGGIVGKIPESDGSRYASVRTGCEVWVWSVDGHLWYGDVRTLPSLPGNRSRLGHRHVQVVSSLHRAMSKREVQYFGVITAVGNRQFHRIRRERV